MTWQRISDNERFATINGRHYFASRCSRHPTWRIEELDQATIHGSRSLGVVADGLTTREVTAWGKPVRLSVAQRQALDRLAHARIGCDFSPCAVPHWSYMPSNSNVRTYQALERLGLVRFRHYDFRAGVSYAGYVITDAGRAVLNEG